jgi:ABC-type Fe3+-hydroxamate transport system substrate-binding protein
MATSRGIAWLVALAALIGAGYVVWSGDRDPEARREPTPPEARMEGFPRAVTIPDGPPVILDHAPGRIVVANTAVLDAVTALVPAERVAALCRQAFTWSEVARAPEGWRELPTFATFVAESVLAHDPDLVLCSPHSLPETVTALRRLGVPVAAVPFAETLEDVRRNLDLVARLLGVEERATRLDQSLDARLAALRARSERHIRPRAVLYTWSGNEGWSSGAATLQDVALELAGARNATAEAGHRGPARLALEQLIGLDPDLFVVPAAYGEVVDATAEHLRSEPALAELRAVAEGHIVELHPSLFSTTSHEIVTTAERIAEAIERLFPSAPTEEKR